MRKANNDKQDQSPKLVYIQAQQKLRELVEGPDFSAGDKILSERELSTILKVSRMTIRKAICNLIEEGILERRGTSGTYITIPQVYRPLDHRSSHSISDIVGSKGDVAGSKLLFFELTNVNKRLAERLAIEEGDEAIVIRRLRTVNDIAFCVETSYIPALLAPGLSAADIVNSPSLYALLEEKYDLKAGRGESLISIAQATHREAELLGLMKKDMTLVYRAIVFDQKNRPMEYVVSVNHPQQVVFKTVHGEISW